MEDLKGYEIREYIEKIKADYLRGEYSYEEAKDLVEPYIIEINKRVKVIAKKHKKAYYELNSVGILR
jgi:hypothetical protein